MADPKGDNLRTKIAKVGVTTDECRWRPWSEAPQHVIDNRPTAPNHLGESVIKVTSMRSEDNTARILLVCFSNPGPCVPVSFMVVPHPMAE